MTVYVPPLATLTQVGDTTVVLPEGHEMIVDAIGGSGEPVALHPTSYGVEDSNVAAPPTGVDPAFSSAEVGNVDADTLVITATETLLDASVTTLDASAFSIIGNTITAVAIIAGNIHLTLGSTALDTDVYDGDLSYVSDGEIVDSDGNALPSFSLQDVANNVAPAGAITVNINILRRSVTQAAPEGFLFGVDITGQNASGPTTTTHDPRLHDVGYFWDYYAAGGADHSYTHQHNVRVDPAHRNNRYTTGPLGAVLYRTPDTMRVKCTVIEIVGSDFATATINTGEGTLDVTVGDPDVVFAGANTVFCDPSGANVGAPAGADTRTFSAIEDALNLIDGQDSTPKRIMLAAGQSFTLNQGQWGLGEALPTTHIVAQPGARPQVAVAGGIAWNDKFTAVGGTKDLIFQGIDFQAGWDPLTVSGAQTGFLTVFDYGPSTALIDNCTMDGFTIGVHTTSNNTGEAERGTFMNDCSVSNWQSYGALEGQRFMSVSLGNSFKMDPDSPTDATSNGGAAWREGGDTPYRVFVANDMFSVCGWSGVAAGSSIAIASMPVLRLNTGGFDGAVGVISGNVIEGGRASLVINPGTSGDPNNPCNFIIDKNDIKSNYHTIHLISSQMGGVTVRNNRMAFTRNTGAQVELDPSEFVLLNNQIGGANNRAAPCRIHHNTMINQRHQFRASGGPAAEVNSTDFDFVTAENNIVHQTLTSPAQVASAPLKDDVNVGAPLNKGYYTVGAAINQPPAPGVIDVRSDSATDLTAGLYDTFEPEAGSSAIGAQSSGIIPADDFFGNLRQDVLSALTRTAPSSGCAEPSLEA